MKQIYKGKVLGSKLVKDYLRILTVSRMFGDNLKAKLYSPAGVDSTPFDNTDKDITTKTIIAALDGDAGQLIALAFLDKIAKIAEPGEFRCYATNNGKDVVAFIHLKNNGSLQVNGDQFGGLVKVQELIDAIDANNAVYNGHSHSVFGGSPNAAMTDLDKSKIENEKVTHG